MSERVTYTELREAKEYYQRARRSTVLTTEAAGAAYINALEAVLAQTEAALHKIAEEAGTNVNTIRFIQRYIDEYNEQAKDSGWEDDPALTHIEQILNRHKKDGKS